MCKSIQVHEFKMFRESLFSPLSHLELCWSVRTAFLVVRLLKMAASVPMKSMYMPENSSWSRRKHAANQQ